MFSRIGCARGFVIILVAVVASAKISIAHHHQLEEEKNEDGHESNAFSPVIFRDRSGKAGIGEGVTCRCEKLDTFSMRADKRMDGNQLT